MIFGASSLAGVSAATSRLSNAVLDRGGCLDLSSFTMVEGANRPKNAHSAGAAEKQIIINKIDMISFVEEKMNKMKSIYDRAIIQINKNISEKSPITEILVKKNQVILYGPLGTGKTFNTKKVCVRLIEND